MFSEAAIILLTKLGNASVHMCKNVCTYSGKMYLKVWQVHLTNCWKTCCCLVRGRPCHHFILLIPSCFHELEEPLLYINQHFSTAEIKSKSPPACRISRNLWYCGGGLWQRASIGGDSGKASRLPSYLPEPGLYFRHLRPTSPCRQLAGGALLPGCEAAGWEKSLSAVGQPASWGGTGGGWLSNSLGERYLAKSSPCWVVWPGTGVVNTLFVAPA